MNATFRFLRFYYKYNYYANNKIVAPNIYRTIWTGADMWHTDELTISPFAKKHTFVFCTLLRGVQPRRSPLLLLVIVCLISVDFITPC